MTRVRPLVVPDQDIGAPGGKLKGAVKAMIHDDAIGLVKTQGLVAMIEAADVMCNAADVEVVGETSIGGNLVLADMIARPHSEVKSLLPQHRGDTNGAIAEL